MLACGKPGMLACWKLGLRPPLLLLLLLGPLGPCSPGAPAAAAPADDAAKLEFSTERPLHLVSPAFLSFTIDANLATDPRFFTFLGSSKLRTLARGLSPAYLRFGGTKADFLIFDPKKEPAFEERSYWLSQVNQDICKSGSIPSDVEKKLQLEWPFQEQVLLREQYQKKFTNNTYSSFPGGASGKEHVSHCRRHKRLRFDPWVGKIPWRRAWQPTPVFLPGESHGQRILVGCRP